jgi:hypothetical protein
MFFLLYPKAIAKGSALGSASVIPTPLGSVTALVDVLTLKSVKLSDPSFTFSVRVFVPVVSTQIVPATAELGVDVPLCEEFNADKILFNSVRKELKP